jgi:hypothetical protein
VISETRQICDSALKPLVNRVSAVKQYGIDKVGFLDEFVVGCENVFVSNWLIELREY